MKVAYVALGSNLGDPQQHLRDAVVALAALPQTCVLARSRMYSTPPWGVQQQPPFVNAAVQLRTALAPEALLDALLAIERAHGRRRDGERWGPRTLDLDLLHVEGAHCNQPRLTLPHPRIGERAFVLLPLNDLAPALELPGQGRVAELLAAVDITGCRPLAQPL